MITSQPFCLQSGQTLEGAIERQGTTDKHARS
jgi:hypothetical protein